MSLVINSHPIVNIVAGTNRHDMRLLLSYIFSTCDIYDVHKEIKVFDPLACIHMILTHYGRSHTTDIKYASLSGNRLYNDHPGLKLKLNYSNYDCNLFETVLF